MARGLATNKSRLLLAGLVLGHLVAISRQVDIGDGVTLFERWLFALFSPLQGLISGGVDGVGGTWSSYVSLRGVREENRHLRDRLAVTELLLQQRTHQAREAARLRELLQLRAVLPLETLVAEVIARDGVPWFRTVTLDKGADQGVTLSAPVISPNGVVGRVIRLGPDAAVVQLLLDQESGVGVRIERSRVTGVVGGQVDSAGQLTGDLQLKYVPMLADVVEGDLVITSGLDRIYPAGLVVGRVRLVRLGAGLFKEILVAPSARFDKLEEVLVVRTPLPDVSVTETVQ
ncbi:MAG TPA: rod shape-determining protein MreC [Vicinamibacteria bacterium]|nr:rod shape-determining protein MreC [Vicinamibacteria bacterium]